MSRARGIPAVRSQDGFTLVELLATTLVLLAAMLGTFTALDGTSLLARRDADRGHAIREAQVGLDRLVRELRHARAVAGTPSAGAVTVEVVRRGVVSTVTFDCAAAHPSLAGTKRCVRTSGSASDVLVDMVEPAPGDPPVFAYTPAGGPIRHVTITLPIRVDGGSSRGQRGRTVLSDGTELRNAP